MIEARIRTRVHPDELDAKVGKIVTAGDYNLVLTGPARVIGPSGKLLAVYAPGVLADVMAEAWPVLSSIRFITDNRGKASGTPREIRGDQKRSRTRRIMSSTIGAVDPGPSITRNGGRSGACRLTAWTGKHLDEWHGLAPVFVRIAEVYAELVPDRYAAQLAWARTVHPDWRISATPFTTITVNNTYSTGVHRDAGDLKEGFSTLAVARRGAYTGGLLVLPEYRLAVDMGDGDLLLFDPHEWHGNTGITCPHRAELGDLARPCPDGCERVSLVAYARTKVAGCASSQVEAGKLVDAIDRHAGVAPTPT